MPEPAPAASSTLAEDADLAPNARPEVVLVGTGHVFDIKAQVQEVIHRRHPTVVALELDPSRYRALREGNRDAKGAPLFYRMLAGFQRRIAEGFGVEAGEEMLAASDAAHDLGVPIALIDVDAGKAFQRLWREMGFMERLRLAGSALASLVLPGGDVEAQVDEIAEDYATYFALLGERYPTLKTVLIDERNAHMAQALRELARRNPRTVAVMGDGHVDGVHELLGDADVDVETVRLKELKQREPRRGGDPTSVTFSVTVEGEG